MRRRLHQSDAAEAAAGGIDRGFSPELNVVTDPRFGRLEENFGEDPNLVAAMGDEAVVGLHGGWGGGPGPSTAPRAAGAAGQPIGLGGAQPAERFVQAFEQLAS